MSELGRSFKFLLLQLMTPLPPPCRPSPKRIGTIDRNVTATYKCHKWWERQRTSYEMSRVFGVLVLCCPPPLSNRTSVHRHSCRLHCWKRVLIKFGSKIGGKCCFECDDGNLEQSCFGLCKCVNRAVGLISSNISIFVSSFGYLQNSPALCSEKSMGVLHFSPAFNISTRS